MAGSIAAMVVCVDGRWGGNYGGVRRRRRRRRRV